jgi:hypothetical protein
LLDASATNEQGGSTLYRMPEAMALDRDAYYRELTDARAASPRNGYLANDPKGVKFAYDSEHPDPAPPSYPAPGLTEALQDYYSFEMLHDHPERVQELADYWTERAAKGRRFNPVPADTKLDAQKMLDDRRAEKERHRRLPKIRDPDD